MPYRDRLTWGSVTAGSQIIIPAYPLLFAAAGLIFLLQDPRRTNSPAYDVAKQLMFGGNDHSAIVKWALVFMGIALIEVLAMALGSRKIFRGVLIAGAFVSGFWSYVIISAAVQSIQVSYTGGLWIGFTCIAHMASARSVTRDRVWFQ